MDPTSQINAVPTFHGYSASGEVKNATVVYANYGRQEDFEYLKSGHINIKVRCTNYSSIYLPYPPSLFSNIIGKRCDHEIWSNLPW